MRSGGHWPPLAEAEESSSSPLQGIWAGERRAWARTWPLGGLPSLPGGEAPQVPNESTVGGTGALQVCTARGEGH